MPSKTPTSVKKPRVKNPNTTLKRTVGKMTPERLRELEKIVSLEKAKRQIRKQKRVEFLESLKKGNTTLTPDQISELEMLEKEEDISSGRYNERRKSRTPPKTSETLTIDHLRVIMQEKLKEFDLEFQKHSNLTSVEKANFAFDKILQLEGVERFLSNYPGQEGMLKKYILVFVKKHYNLEIEKNYG